MVKTWWPRTGISNLQKKLSKTRIFLKISSYIRVRGAALSSANDNKKSEAINPNNDRPPAMISEYIKNFRQKGLSVLSDMSKGEQTIFVSWAQDVVDRYGHLLQENPSKIKNVADLPCPKEDLKIAIKVLLPAYLAKGSDDIVDLLKDRYVRLGAFQEISQEDRETILKKPDQIDQKSESTDTSLFSTYQKYMEVIISEQNILLEDINTFVDDLQIQKEDS